MSVFQDPTTQFAKMVAEAPEVKGAVGNALAGGKSQAQDDNDDSQQGGEAEGAAADGADQDGVETENDAEAGESGSADEGSDEGEAGGDGGDGEDGRNDAGENVESTDEARLIVAKEFGFESLEGLDAKTLKMIDALIAAAGKDEEADGDGLTDEERKLLFGDDVDETAGDEGKDRSGDKSGDKGEEDKPKAEAKDGSGQPALNTPRDIARAVINGQLGFAFDGITGKNGYYALLAKAKEDNDVERFNQLENQRFLAQAQGFIVPLIEELLATRLKEVETKFTPVVESYERSRQSNALMNARDTALERLSKIKNFSDMQDMLVVDSKSPQVVITRTDGSKLSLPSSPFAHVIKANPHLLDISTKGKNGKEDPVATFVSMYMAAHKHWKSTGATAKPKLTKADAAKLVKAGAAAANRAKQKAAGGGLNKSTPGTGSKGGGSKQVDWGKDYLAKSKGLSF